MFEIGKWYRYHECVFRITKDRDYRGVWACVAYFPGQKPLVGGVDIGVFKGSELLTPEEADIYRMGL